MTAFAPPLAPQISPRPLQEAMGARALVVMLVLALALLLAACGRGDGSDSPPEPGDRAVARVQDQVIWASDVKREAVAQGLIGEGEPLDITSDLFRRVLDEVIDQKLLAREAERRGLHESPLARRRLQATRERILGDMLVETVVDGTISEQAVRTLYEEQLRLARESEEIRARLILTATREQADAIISLLNAGASFEAVAMERSIDEATRFQGGDLGYFTTDVMPEAYARAIGAARAGDTVGPFETEGGFGILRIEDRRRETPPTLEQARPQIVRYLTYDGVRQLLEQLRGRARVSIMLEGDPLAVPGAPREPASAPRAAPSPAPAQTPPQPGSNGAGS